MSAKVSSLKAIVISSGVGGGVAEPVCCYIKNFIFILLLIIF